MPHRLLFPGGNLDTTGNVETNRPCVRVSNCVQIGTWKRKPLPQLDLAIVSMFPGQNQEHTFSTGGNTAAASGSGALLDSRHWAARLPLCSSAFSTMPAS